MVESKVNRCHVCNKKLTLGDSIITCRCHEIFCIYHRDAVAHNCPYDIRKHEQDRIKHTNIQVIASKINLI